MLKLRERKQEEENVEKNKGNLKRRNNKEKSNQTGIKKERQG